MVLGQLRVPFSKRQYFVITGGPYRDRPPLFRGVKMAAEVDLPCAVDIPTEDFNVPEAKVLAEGLSKAVDLVLAGEPLYVGCMGGKGRTGLFLAVLAKAFGVEKPVEYVRSRYYGHAVETDEQYAFVTDFPVEAVVQKIALARYARRWAWLKFWKRNLTRLPAPEGELKHPAYRRS